jgi:glycerate 2-kinase
VTPLGAARVQLERVLSAALAAVDAEAAVARAVSSEGDELLVAGEPIAAGQRIWLLAVGKAAAGMARAFERVAGGRLAGGVAITKDGHGLPLQRIALRFAGHPLPDSRSEAAAREALQLVERAGEGDALVVLLSGGASSLLAAPAPGLTLADIAACTAALLASGADIAELNAVRKHLSAVSGGRLGRAAACRRIEVLAISDVVGDRLDVIGSGLFAADPTTYAEAEAILRRRGVVRELPEAVRAHLAAGSRGEREETPKPGAAALARIRSRLLATNAMARAAAAAEAASLGMRSIDLGEVLAGEARTAGRRLAGLASALPAGTAGGRPLCLVAGGETVVTLRGAGRGGRNQELALAAAGQLAGCEGVALLAVGTDGTDGPTEAAGAYVDGGTLARGRARGREVARDLDANDSHTFFHAEGGLLVTGPTRTNVMDLALLRVGRSDE